MRRYPLSNKQEMSYDVHTMPKLRLKIPEAGGCLIVEYERPAPGPAPGTMHLEIKAADRAEIPPPDSRSEAQPQEHYLRASTVEPELRRWFENHFDLEELRNLCQDLYIDYDNLRGEGKAGKARALASYLIRHSRLTQLISWVGAYRPNILETCPWPLPRSGDIA